MLALGMFSVEGSKPQFSAIHPRVRARFARWLKEHKMSFNTPAEYFHRLSVFAKTHNKIVSENAKQNDYVLGHNQFSHLTEEEFIAKYTGLKMPENYERNIVPTENVEINQSTEVDWRKAGAVGPVKNQANCGSCWAFSATASVEGAWKISGKALENLSEQQLVDCSTSFGNHGCNGGWMDYAFAYLLDSKVGGQMRTSNYPYTAVDGSCKFKSSDVVAKLKGYKDVGKNDCADLLKFATAQPTSVAIAANAIMSYKSGVFSNAGCGTGLNHGVTLVGYGKDQASGKDYYLVRNSWGAGWGEEGYIKMDRNVQTSTGICGICMAASTATA